MRSGRAGALPGESHNTSPDSPMPFRRPSMRNARHSSPGPQVRAVIPATGSSARSSTACGVPALGGDHVQAMPHPIYKGVAHSVSVSGRAEHHFGARGAAATGVRGPIARTQNYASVSTMRPTRSFWSR